MLIADCGPGFARPLVVWFRDSRFLNGRPLARQFGRSDSAFQHYPIVSFILFFPSLRLTEGFNLISVTVRPKYLFQKGWRPSKNEPVNQL